MEIITGYTGKKHITPEHDRDIHIGTYGDNSYVLSTGMKMEAEVSSNNEIKIRDGVLIHQGCAASIKKNTYDSLQIVNGSQGMKRVDLIIARYKKDKNTGIETLQLEVLKGTPSETEPMSPSYISGDIQAGDTVSDMPMYKITIDGLNIVAVDQLFTVLPSMATINKDLADTSDKIAVKSYKQADVHLQSFYNVSAFSAYKVGREVHFNVSLDPKSGTTLLANKLYAITSAAIATDLRPAVLTHIQCVGCGQGWENTCAVMAYVDTNGIIYFSTPATRAFYKFHGIWIAAN